ncbi:MAG: helix-turn-helix domain-containing protein [Sphingopyxis sp.]|nr:helix-turn-helix domain-containing protein [Sphingopyxis sp.]
MSDSRASKHLSEASLDRLKEFSGRRIESERLRFRLSQKHFARRAGLSVRWLREVESGNPSVKLDDHLRCAAALNLAPAAILLPLFDPDCDRPSRLRPLTNELADIEHLICSYVSRLAGRAGHCDADFVSAGHPVSETQDATGNRSRGGRRRNLASPDIEGFEYASPASPSRSTPSAQTRMHAASRTGSVDR